jgi:hypothetical protein
MNVRKLVVTSSVILFALCAPALAGTPPPGAVPPTAGASAARVAHSIALVLEVKDPAATFHYVLPLETEQCGSVEDTRAAGMRDVIQICLTEVAAGIGVRVQWRSDRGTATYEVKASSVTTAGKPFTIGRDGGSHLTVSWK